MPCSGGSPSDRTYPSACESCPVSSNARDGKSHIPRERDYALRTPSAPRNCKSACSRPHLPDPSRDSAHGDCSTVDSFLCELIPDDSVVSDIDLDLGLDIPSHVLFTPSTHLPSPSPTSTNHRRVWSDNHSLLGVVKQTSGRCCIIRGPLYPSLVKSLLLRPALLPDPKKDLATKRQPSCLEVIREVPEVSSRTCDGVQQLKERCDTLKEELSEMEYWVGNEGVRLSSGAKSVSSRCEYVGGQCDVGDRCECVGGQCDVGDRCECVGGQCDVGDHCECVGEQRDMDDCECVDDYSNGSDPHEDGTHSHTTLPELRQRRDSDDSIVVVRSWSDGSLGCLLEKASQRWVDLESDVAFALGDKETSGRVKDVLRTVYDDLTSLKGRLQVIRQTSVLRSSGGESHLSSKNEGDGNACQNDCAEKIITGDSPSLLKQGGNTEPTNTPIAETPLDCSAISLPIDCDWNEDVEKRGCFAQCAIV